MALLVAAVVACGSPEGDLDEAFQLGDLRSRPDVDEITAAYEDMQAALRERLGREMGLARWTRRNGISSSGCREFPRVGQRLKEARVLPQWTLDIDFPEDKWFDAVAIISEVASGYGFDDPITMANEPRWREVALSDEYGGKLVLGAKAAVVLHVQTGCHPRPDQESAEQLRELRARPDIDDVTRRYEELSALVRERTAAELGLPAWESNTERSSSGCRDYPAVDQFLKEARGLPGWYTRAGVPDDKWPEAVRIITRVGAEYGFGDPVTVVDGPGDHEVSLVDRYGGELIFGTRTNTAMYVRTGCHPVFGGSLR